MFRLQELPESTIEVEVAKFLDFEDTKQLRHSSHAFFNDQRLLASQRNLERQLNQPRLLISECREVIYSRKFLYVSTRSDYAIRNSWHHVKNQTIVLKDSYHPFYKIPIALEQNEKVIQMIAFNAKIFLLTNLGQALSVTEVQHRCVDYQFSVLEPKRVSFEPLGRELNADEKLTQIRRSFFISNQGNVFLFNNRLLENCTANYLLPAGENITNWVFKDHSGSVIFSTSTNTIYSCASHNAPVITERLAQFTHGTIKDLKSTSSTLFILTTEGYLYSMEYNTDENGYRLCIDQQVKSISVSNSHVILLTNDEKIYSWGKNNRGQLGIGSRRDTNVFTEAPLPMKRGEYIVNMQCGKYFSAIETNLGHCYLSGQSFGNLLSFISTHFENLPNQNDTDYKIAGFLLALIFAALAAFLIWLAIYLAPIVQAALATTQGINYLLIGLGNLAFITATAISTVFCAGLTVIGLIVAFSCDKYKQDLSQELRLSPN